MTCAQQGRLALEPPYSGFGDSLYSVNLECLRTYYRVYFIRELIMEYMRICDAEMTACRESIEWDYAKTGNIFKICKDPANFKLGQKNPVSVQNIQLQIALLCLSSNK